MDADAQARARLVDEHIATRGIHDARVLAAMRTVPRHEFVDPARRADAYADRAIPIAHGQTISQPYMVAVMTQALRLTPEARVLEIGTGSGYQAAVLASIAAEVISIERHRELAAPARDRLARLGFTDVIVVDGDGSRGWPALAPFDAIVVTAGAPTVPDALRAQLSDGGRLVIPVGPRHVQHLLVITREGDRFHEQTLDTCAFVPLVGPEAWPD
jgi:protein-L-isoaspartate(D-aspartate) O-methyltransferase